MITLFIRKDSLQNEADENGNVIGFTFAARNVNYRGVYLSLHNGYYIRADGTAYSVYSFGTKLSSALVGSAGVLLLAKAGYAANAVQTPQAMQGINMVVNVLPGVCWLMALIPLVLYNLKEETYSGRPV